ncbi:hypothetical protein SAMN07250955_10775 [Arboricoccus pini]|uniref:DUF6314 domain-containing protein n=1 Tax=Arboricoccus pini TaxID=1963835 RepID=A0A212RCG6_9PROT|nr:DUF6314 family protein [Arboricoccus pini]SNB69910.1 hypothetical protein SAMN07250955_10775 [Arboricoccus pini]
MSGEHLIERLVGAWQLSRVISNGASYRGRAVWRPEAGHLHYREDGTMRLADGRIFSCYRSYLFQLDELRLTVYFDEQPPRLFHRMELKAGDDGTFRAEGHHDCGRDRYLTTYEIGNFIRIVHDVKGPFKDYRLIGTYQRQTVR